MKCFNHPNVEAVATCKSCCRALCHDCIAEVGLSCSCRGRCESDVQAINDMIERSRTVYQKSAAIYTRIGILTLLLGGLFFFVGMIAFPSGPNNYLCTGGGIIFGAVGAVSIYSGIRYKQKR